MTEGRTRVTLSLAPADVAALRQIAAELHLVSAAGPRGGQGNLSALLQGIARGTLKVVPTRVLADWSFIEGTVEDVQRRIEQVEQELEGVREVIGAAK